ncbi:coiled-coil domain-containing protein 170-like isoform X2 [Panulirus ornatus]|uniref:coiled-coil domain-containing protein 170-like isoform X2 n=1 Tax=Panulirus ornatus TaxID=150431 RepID=UPI003A8415BE
MSVFRQESLSEEVSRESATFTAVAGGGVALHFKTSTSSTSTTSTQTTSETVVQRMVGTDVHTSGSGMGTVNGSGLPVSSLESPPQQTAVHNTVIPPSLDWTPATAADPTDNMALFESEMKRKDHLIEELIKLHPSHGLNKVRGGEAEEALRSDLAGMTVKVERLEQQLRDALASVASRDARVTELTRQLDAHRQEHARQAATIVTLRQKLQEEEAACVSLKASQRRGEFTVGALTRETRQAADRISELECRLKTHLEEREAAEQRSETAQRRLLELVRMVTSSLSLGDLDPQDIQEKLSTRLADLVQECARLRSEVLRMTEELEQREGEAEATRQTVGRLVNELDDEKHTVEEQKSAMEEYRREGDDLRTRLRATEEEVKSVKERLHNTNKSYNTTLEELHTAEKQLQQAKDAAVVSDHRRQQSEVEGRGFLTTVAALLSTPEHRLSPEPQAITDRIQSLVATNRETTEHVDRLTSQVTTLGEQTRRQTELYETAVKRGRQSEADLHALSNRCRQLEADHAAAEAAREHLTADKEKAGRTLARVVEALGLSEMGKEVTSDIEMIICRCQQLAKLEGEKIVDKTTTVYQLQRKVKGLREAVERKDLHVDMLRRKLALTEDAARASRHLEEERDDLIAKYKRQCRAVDRLNGEMAESRLQIRDLHAQLADAAEEKTRGGQQQKKIEELTAKINELDAIRSRQQKKISHLKEQVKAHGEHVLEERRLNESSLEGLTQELALTKQAFRDLTRREKQMTEFRRTVMELLGTDGEAGVEGDYEAICRLERVVGAHRELTDLSRRLDEITAPSRPNRMPIDQNFLHMSDELRALADDAHNHRPNTRSIRRPPSAHARTPSPTKRPSTDEDEDI